MSLCPVLARTTCGRSLQKTLDPHSTFPSLFSFFFSVAGAFGSSNAHSVPLGARCYDVSRGLAPARPGGFNHMPGERTLFHGRLQEGLSAKPREKGFEVIPKAAPARDQPRSNSLDPGPAAVGPICTAAHAAEPDMPFTEPDTHVRT